MGKILFQFFFSHRTQLLCIGDSILNLLDFLEYFVLISRKGVSLGIESIRNAVDLCQDIRSWFKDDDEGSARRGSNGIVGYVESVKNAVALTCAKDHFREFQQISRVNYSRHVYQPQLLQSGLSEIHSLLPIFPLTIEYLPGLEKQVFVVLKIHNLFLGSSKRLGRFIQGGKLLLNLIFHLIEYGQLGDPPRCDNCIVECVLSACF